MTRLLYPPSKKSRLGLEVEKNSVMKNRRLEDTLHLETDLIKGRVDPKEDLVTLQQLEPSIRIVYRLQQKNWIRFPIFARHHETTMSERFRKIVEKMYETQDRLSYDTYTTFKKIKFVKFQPYYTRLEWNRLVARMAMIVSYYEYYKDELL